jgi:putative transposase
MWSADTRAQHDRDDLRYPNDLTDAEWPVLAPLLPPACRDLPTTLLTDARADERDLLRPARGCLWRMLPEHVPSHQTVFRWFTGFRDDRT